MKSRTLYGNCLSPKRHMPKPADILIYAPWIVPVVPQEMVYYDHAIAIAGGNIVDIVPGDQAKRLFEPATTLQLDDQVLIPGLINAHTHAGMNLFRGLADDLPLMEWLNAHIWPAEQRWISEQFVRDGARHAVAEMLLSGTTCFNDMYFFPQQTGSVAAEAGMRAMIGLIIIDLETPWARDAHEYLVKAGRVHDEFRQHPLLRTCFAPHAPYSVGDEPLARIATLAEELDIPITIHLHETKDEVEQSVADTGERPIERLKRFGLLSPRLLGVHMTQLSERDLEELQTHRAHVVHCPESNMKLAAGACPIAQLETLGINVALGTDGAACNNDLDMFGEMRSAALLGKLTAGTSTAIAAHKALQLASLNGARALGMENTIGSLEAGKAADIVSVDLRAPALQPVHDPVSQIVYCATGRDVSNVWVAGEPVVVGGELTRRDQDSILRQSASWAARIAAE